MATSAPTSYVNLPGSDQHLVPNSRSAGPVDPDEIATITVRVRGKRGAGALERRVEEQAAKPMAEREYLTHEQLAEQYGASKEDLDAVERFARIHDLIVARRSSRERSIVLRGKLRDLRAAFRANIAMYHSAGGTYRGRQGEIQIPEALTDVVTGVIGFDTRPKHRRVRVEPATVGGPDSDIGGSRGVSPTFFSARYNFPQSENGKILDGTGETVAIIELGGGYRTSDLQLYFQTIGSPLPNVSAISVDHAKNSPSSAQSADGEVMLDIEVVGAVAPGANIAVYFAPNTGSKGFVDALSAAVHDTERNPSVVSISWGEPEGFLSGQDIQAFHEVLVDAAALGVTVCAAAGDHGSADMAAEQWDGKIHVDHPAADPFVLACGGTQVEGGRDIAWNDETPFDPAVGGGGGWATGGGISEVFPLPSYQTGANKTKSLATGNSGRGVPDIAMSATDYFVRVDRLEVQTGGTSAVAPLAASLMCLLNQAKGKRVGFINPFLYANADKGVTRDVTLGNNAIKNSADGYDAGIGWDACTGLGTLDGTATLANL